MSGDQDRQGSSAARPALPALTGLRFVAALGVLLFHYQWLVALPPVLKQVARYGETGVNLFFVLSGFILTYTYQAWFTDGVQLARPFWWARVSRVVPMHLVALALVTPLGLYRVYWSEAGTAHPPAALLGSWLANLLLVQAWLPYPIMHEVWNLPLWSLSDEAFMYVVFPAACLWLNRRASSVAAAVRLTLGCWVGLGLVSLAGLALALLASGGAGQPGILKYWRYVPVITVWEFLVGCAIGLVYLRGGRLGARGRPAVIVAVAVLWSLPAAGLITWPAHASLGPFYTPLYGALILALASGPSRPARWLAHPWMVRLGEASYSLYLLHWLPMIVLGGMRGAGLAVPDLVVWGVMAGTVGASLAAFQVVERPARRALRALPQWGRSVVRPPAEG